MQITPLSFNAHLFTATAGPNTMIAEASTLGLSPGVAPYASLYDDACDVGITLYNPRTKVETRWVLRAEVCSDGDITHWIFDATSETLRKHPHLKHWRVDILND